MLNIVIKFWLVNLPIYSKYYHRQLPVEIKSILPLIREQSQLREKAYLLEHLTSVMNNDPTITLNQLQSRMLNKQLQLWLNRKQKNDRLATIAWVIKKANLLQKQKILFQQILYRIIDDEWYVNFDESVKAMQAFTHIAQGGMKNQIYRRIQRNVNITIWEVNMEYYRRLTKSLLAAGRFSSPLWDQIQTHVISNLGMSYSFQCLCDIFQAYALSRNGHTNFYQMLQKAIYKGHFQNRSLEKIINKRRQYISGQFLALLIHTYSTFNKNNSSVILIPQFLQYIFQSLKNPQIQYQFLSSYTTIIKQISGLQFDQEQQNEIILSLMNKKLPKIALIDDIIQFYKIIKVKSKNLFKIAFQKLQYTIIYGFNQKQISILQGICLLQFLFQNENQHNLRLLFESFNQYLLQNLQYLPSQETKIILSKLQQFPKIYNNLEFTKQLKLE